MQQGERGEPAPNAFGDALDAHSQTPETMQYTIHIQYRERHNDWIDADDGYYRRGSGQGDRQLTYDTEEDGHPVVIMESGVQSFEDDGCVYHEKARVCKRPAKTWEEALEVAGVDPTDKEYAENSPLNGSLQPGDPDYWAVEVLSLVEEPA